MSRKREQSIMQVNQNNIEKLLEAIKLLKEKNPVTSSTKMCILNLEDIERIAINGVSTIEDVQIAQATISWAAGILCALRDGEIRLMRVDKSVK